MNVFTASQAAEQIGCSVAQLRRLIRAGRISAVDICVSERRSKPRYRIPASSIEAFVAGTPKTATEPTPKPVRRARIDAGVPQVF